MKKGMIILGCVLTVAAIPIVGVSGILSGLLDIIKDDIVKDNDKSSTDNINYDEMTVVWDDDVSIGTYDRILTKHIEPIKSNLNSRLNTIEEEFEDEINSVRNINNILIAKVASDINNRKIYN